MHANSTTNHPPTSLVNSTTFGFRDIPALSVASTTIAANLQGNLFNICSNTWALPTLRQQKNPQANSIIERMHLSFGQILILHFPSSLYISQYSFLVEYCTPGGSGQDPIPTPQAVRARLATTVEPIQEYCQLNDMSLANKEYLISSQ